MANSVPTVLILGHSFVKRLRQDLESGFHGLAKPDFGLKGSATVHLFGVGGRTVSKVQQHDLHVVSLVAPDIVLLEIGTNDLSHRAPEVVGSSLEELVHLLLREFSVRVIGVCHVIPRGANCSHFSDFNAKAGVLNRYLSVVLEPIPNVFSWYHKGFTNPAQALLADGVHVNPIRQYRLYRSY